MSKGRKVVASTDEYTVYLRRDTRHAVEGADGRAINGDEKVAILLKHDLVKAPAPKAPAPEPEAAEEPAEADAAAEATDDAEEKAAE
jgi:hypothetical protein